MKLITMILMCPVTSRIKPLLLAASALSLAALPAFCQENSPGEVPLPAPRPAAANLVLAAVPEPFITGAIPVLNPTVSDLKAGLDALSARDPARAIRVRDSMAPGSLDRHLLTWVLATSGISGIPSAEIARASRELRGWPGLENLRANSERALYRENPAADQVLAAFGSSKPETPEGAIILSRALVATGQRAKAQAFIRDIWLHQTLDEQKETAVLAEFSNFLTVADHKARMDYLLFHNRLSQAERFSKLGQAYSLYKAWTAVAQRSSAADELIAKVDSKWSRDPCFLFARIQNLRHKEEFDAAAKLLTQVPRSQEALINPGEWWDEQRIVSRGLLDDGKSAAAYDLVNRQVATSSSDIVEAEFHAGWYALRALDKPAIAKAHFRKILAVSNGPLSRSRAFYWLARTEEAERSPEAKSFYLKAAAYPTTFYGQLAAEKLGYKTLNVEYPSPTAEDRRRFQAREGVQAIDRLNEAGYGWRATALYLALARQLDSAGELAILAARAEREGNDHLSLQIGKIAYARGVNVAALAFPTGVIPTSANISGSGKALAYAIARQESAFNPAAVSAADARGLLQLMPQTAKAVAGRHGIPYSPAKLTQDPGYNATIGAHYLGEQIDAFSGSYVLTFVAYNAGPRKVTEWIARFGDPRGKPLDDVIDWIERIPYPETRNYVQRVMENYEVYKARLGDRPDIDHDLIYGRS